jgi:hypothetical protein
VAGKRLDTFFASGHLLIEADPSRERRADSRSRPS